jgi:hypothetical protein
MPFSTFEGELKPLLAAHAFSVLVMEIDRATARGKTIEGELERINCLLWSHGYALLLKVPCSGRAGAFLERTDPHFRHRHAWSHRTAYMPLSGKYHANLPLGWGKRESSCEMGGRGVGGDWSIQDLVAIDTRQPELAALITLGNQECGFSFQSDIIDGWPTHEPSASASSEAVATAATLAQFELTGENERHRPTLWGGFEKDPPPKERRNATLLPDGSWSCGPLLSAQAREVLRHALRTGVAEGPPRCK